MKKTLTLPATQTSPCGTMKLVPSLSPFNDRETWWRLSIKSPKNGSWVEINGGHSAYWMTDLGFNPYV